MTNADTINLKLAEMEGKCPHKRLRLVEEGIFKYYCPDCDTSFKKKPVPPDRLSDGAYILGLVKELKKQEIIVMYVKDTDMWSVGSYDNMNKENWIDDESLEHAIALAAIQRWMEGRWRR